MAYHGKGSYRLGVWGALGHANANLHEQILKIPVCRMPSINDLVGNWASIIQKTHNYTSRNYPGKCPFPDFR